MSACREQSERAGRLRNAVFCAALLLALVARPALPQETWQQQVGTFRIGVLAEPGDDAVIRGLSALKKAFTLALGVPVEFFVARDYRTLIEAQSEKRIDYAVYSATAYATAALACDCVEPLVAPTGSNGALGIRAVLIARADSFSTLAEMPKHRVTLAGKDDVAGFQLPLISLRKEGLALTGDEAFFVHVGSGEEAQALLLAGEVDAIFGWIETGIGKAPLPGSGTLEKLAAAGSAAGPFRIVWTSDLLRYGPHAIGKDLDPEVRRRLVPFLTGLRDTDPALFETLARFQLGGFVGVNEDDYTTALELVREGSSPAR